MIAYAAGSVESPHGLWFIKTSRRVRMWPEGPVGVSSTVATFTGVRKIKSAPPARKRRGIQNRAGGDSEGKDALRRVVGR